MLIGSLLRVDQLYQTDPICPECNSKDVLDDRHSGILVCTNCGLQLGGQMISEEAEWREFEDDGPMSHAVITNRCGNDEYGLSTVMGKTKNKENEGVNWSSLSKLQTITTKQPKKLMDRCEDYIPRIAALLSLPQSIVDHTYQLIQNVSDAKIFPMNQHEKGIMSACLLISCRVNNNPRSLKEICPEIRQQRKTAKCFKMIKESKLFTKSLPSHQPTQSIHIGLVTRYCSALKLPFSIEKSILDLVQSVEKMGFLEGRMPSTIVGSCIYMICHDSMEHKRQYEQIATICLTAVITLKAAYNILDIHRKQLVLSIQ